MKILMALILTFGLVVSAVSKPVLFMPRYKKMTIQQEKKMDTIDLCTLYQDAKNDTGSAVSRELLKTLNVVLPTRFTPQEWTDIQNEYPQIGDSGDTVVCALGYADQINTDELGPDQLVYESYDMYVYEKDDVVVDVQTFN